MPGPRRQSSAELGPAFHAIRERLGVVDQFAPDVIGLAEARAQTHSESTRVESNRIPEARADRREIELWSIDPLGSRDLDQALHVERHGSGFVFHYAIADVGAWLDAGDVIDHEARRRGTTVYCPDLRVPLHPVALSEGAASLLPDSDRPALLWRIGLDQRGETQDVTVERATVRNRRARSYAEVQQSLDTGTADAQAEIVVEIGTLRRALEVERGGVSLPLPEQSVSRVGDHFELEFDAALAIEEHNAQLSLCCGIAAAELMVAAGAGILRTLPPADTATIDKLRRHSLALDVAWPDGVTYPEWARSLDASTPAGAALMVQAARTLRGAGYLAFDGDLPAEHRHNAIAAPYAHVTAPIRRLVDRFANECALAAAAGKRPPEWVLAAFAEMPQLMATANQRASAVDRAVVEVTEAAVLAHRVGETFDAIVTSVDRGRLTVQLKEPAVIASVELSPDGGDGANLLGTSIRIRLTDADPSGATGPIVAFSPETVSGGR